MLNLTTDGWRGIDPDDINESTIRKLCKAIGNYHEPTRILIGFDTRTNSRNFAETCFAELSSSGHECFISAKPLPTPVLSWATREFKATLGIQITASHNPPAYNGIKLRLMDGTSPDTGYIKKIAVYDGKFRSGGDTVICRENFCHIYSQYLAKKFDYERMSRRFPCVAVDSMHGTTSGLLRQIFQDKIKILGVRENPDPSFGGCAPEPKEQNLGPLADIVLGADCEIGFAHDGDGDRIAAWDREFGFVSPQNILKVLAWLYAGSQLPGILVTSSTTTKIVELIAKKYQRGFLNVDVGFHHASRIMCEQSVLLAGEENGGMAFGSHFPDRDGTYAALFLLDGLAQCNKSISSILAEIDREFGGRVYRRHDIKMFEGVNWNPTQILFESFGTSSAVLKEIKNGAKVSFADDSWVVLRRAGTEPLLRIYIEALDEERVTELENTLKKIIEYEF